MPTFADTVLVLIKLTKNPMSVRLRCGCCKLTFCLYFIIFAMFKNIVHSFVRILYIVWNPVRRRETGVSPGSKLYATFFNIAKYFKTVRCGCGCGAVAVAFIFSICLKLVLYKRSWCNADLLYTHTTG